MGSSSDVSSSHRESRSRDRSGRHPSHSDRSSSHSDRSVSHNDRSSSHRGRSSSHRGRSSSHRGRSSSHKERSVSRSSRSSIHRDRSSSHRDRSSSHNKRSVSHSDHSRSITGSHHSRSKSRSHHSRSKSRSHHSKSERKYTKSEEREMRREARAQLRQGKSVRKENRRIQREERDSRLVERRRIRSITREEHNKRKAEIQAQNDIILRQKEDRLRYKNERDDLESAYKNEFRHFLRLRENFDELLGKQLKKDVPFELEKDVYNYNHIEDFKHLLLDNSFRIDVEVDEVHRRQVTIFRPHIKESKKKKKRFSVISKKKEELSTMYNSELGELCDAFEAMYAVVNKATHGWWSYKKFAHAPVKPSVEEQPRANRREIWLRFTKNQNDAVIRKARKEERTAKRERNMIRRQRKLDAGLPVKEKQSKKKPQILKFKQEIQEEHDNDINSPIDDSNVYENYDGSVDVGSDENVYSYYSD